MSSTLISEPFQLYLSSTLAQKRNDLEAVYATYNPDCPSYATVTGQSEGIHVLDIQNLHAVASYFVEKRIAFALPAVSLYVSEDGNKLVISYVLIEDTPGLAPHLRRRTVWVIRHRISGTTLAVSTKTSKLVEIPPVQICVSGYDALPLLLVSENGSLFLSNAQVDIKYRLDWPGERQHVKTYVFPLKSCSFIQGDTNSYSNVAVTCCRINLILHIRVVLLGEGIVSVGACEIPMESSIMTVMHGITCSPSGVLSFVDSRGMWASYQLLSLNSTLNSTPISDHLHLRQWTKPAAKRQGISIVSLDTSLALLAAVVGLEGTREISLQIWDLAYGVILTSYSMPIPSAIPDPHLSLTLANEGQALLAISPSSVYEKKVSPQRSAIHIIPVDARLKSSIAAALGKASLTAQWVEPKAAPEPKSQEDNDESESAMILSSIQKSLKKKHNAQNAEQAFLKWLDSQSSKEAALGHEFVKKTLNIVLAPEPSTNHPYTPRITRCILENAVVSTIMLNGRLITALRQRGDWENLMFALTTVADVSEDELMASAKFIIDKQRRIENAMDVDASEGYVPPLWSYLFACLSYTFSAAPMRLAIRKYLPDAQDLVVVLQILENWIQGGTEHEVGALLRSMATDTQMVSSEADSPPYPKVIMFLHALLDASFVALLQYPPSHDILRRILSYVEPEIRFIDSLEPLRGMLEPFAKVQSLKERTGLAKESPGEYRKREKQLAEQASLTVGLYRLEELSI